jgi:hypothetical protein
LDKFSLKDFDIEKKLFKKTKVSLNRRTYGKYIVKKKIQNARRNNKNWTEISWSERACK